MDLLIRKVKPDTIYAIDQLVDEQNKNLESGMNKISRNDFLKSEIEKLPTQRFRDDAESKVAVQLQAMSEYLQETEKALNAIFYLLVNGDSDTAENILKGLSDDGEQ